MYKYAFIGAGPAALTAVSSLPNSDRCRSIVIELGKAEDRRICPELKSKSCSSCFEENCHVLNGLGGASATFGNKFCHLPASEGLFANMKPSERERHSVGHGMGAKTLNAATVIQHPNVPNRKVYDVQVAKLDDYREILNSLVRDVRSTTEIMVETGVDQIEEIGLGGYRLHLSTGSTIEAEQVIVATGRSGHKALRGWLSSLRVDFTENSPDIGFRIELPTRAVSEHFFYQDDPKYKFDFGELGSARTFCTCKGGAIVPVKFGRSVYADGAFLRKDTELTNLALMARTNDIFAVTELEDWCELENRKSSNVLVRGSFDVSGLSFDEVKQNVLACIPAGPKAAYAVILEMLVEQLLDRSKINLLSSDLKEPTKMSIYGPSIDNFWPKVELTSSFETSSAGLFVIGDAAGYSRGIYQAMFAGRAWAASQLIEQKISIAK